MARPLRLEFEGATWHVTARGNERKAIFRDDADRIRFLELLGEAVVRYNWILHDYVEMTNHYHLTLQTPETTLSRGMQWLNSRYAQYFNRRHDRVGHLFQGRFHGVLVDQDAYFLTLCRYVVRNPVRARGIVDHPGQWRWSSYAAKAGLVEAPPWLHVSTTLAAFHPSDTAEAQRKYREFINAPDAAVDRPWEHLHNQIYLAGEEWIARIQAKIDQAPRSPDHPKPQRHPRRPRMDEILSAVAQTFGTTVNAIRTQRGGVPRMVAAWLGVFDGIHFRRTIAAELGIGNGRVTTLVTACARALESDDHLRTLIEKARHRIANRPPPITYIPRRTFQDLIRDSAAPSAT
jgi:putative transposase